MKCKTIIFFPVEPGIAHVTRCLAIAGVLKKRGHRVIFAICKEKQQLPRQAEMEVVSLPIFLRDDFARWIETLKDPKQYLSTVREELQVLKWFKPDVAVVDFRLTAILASRMCGVPTVFITGSGGLPYGCYIPNPGYPRFLHYLLQPLFQKASGRAKQPYIDGLLTAGTMLGHTYTTNDLFDQMVYLIPEVNGYLPAADNTLKRHYVGPIFWEGFAHYTPPWLEKISPDGHTVYVSFGGTGLDGQKLVDLSALLVERGYRVVVSSSNIVDIKAFPQHPRLFVTKYISGRDICRRVDIVVCHGGYGTMMQAALSGKPVVAVPFNPDQILHSLRFQELALGKTVMNLDLMTIFRLNWKKLQMLASSVSNEQISDAVSLILSDDSKYKTAIERFMISYNLMEGNIKAADIIEQSAS